ncbi:PD40 domain-containing protein [Candidatus Poribacteria bacterium]|nr:PD40 domain-containing protein [Candidatus Poribacteria bacterium]
MKTTRLLAFTISILWTLNANVCPIFAEAPTTSKILFTSTRDGNREIYTMNPDGSEQVRLTHHPANDLSAVWSPTGEQILFISDRDGVRDLFLMDSDGSNIRRVFKKEVYRGRPAWSPDGTQIAYMHLRWDIDEYPTYIATLGEENEEELIMNAHNPVWSPDGTEIACSISAQIKIVNVRTGTQKRPLSRKIVDRQWQMSWSTVGNKIAFIGNKHPLPDLNGLDLKEARALHKAWEDKHTVFIMNSDGSGFKQLVAEAGPQASGPAISPNGEEVLYTQEIKGLLHIFKVDVNSGVTTQLTHIGHIFQANSGGDWFDPAYALPVSPEPQLLTTTWGAIKTQK